MIFVAHPMSGDIDGNTKKVIAICKSIHSEEIIPVFPSLTWRQYLAGHPNFQNLAAAVNEEYFRRGLVDEIWLYGDRLSDGMEREVILAMECHIPVIPKTPETTVALSELISGIYRAG